jgi:hypothetical protein
MLLDKAETSFVKGVLLKGIDYRNTTHKKPLLQWRKHIRVKK